MTYRYVHVSPSTDNTFPILFVSNPGMYLEGDRSSLSLKRFTYLEGEPLFITLNNPIFYASLLPKLSISSFETIPGYVPLVSFTSLPINFDVYKTSLILIHVYYNALDKRKKNKQTNLLIIIPKKSSSLYSFVLFINDYR